MTSIRRLAVLMAACLPCLPSVCWAGSAEQILAQTGVQGGLIVHLGCGDGAMTAALGAGDGFLVHGLDVDPRNVAAAREHVKSLGLYGKVSVDTLRGERLPYVDNLVNLVVSEDLSGVFLREVMRVLRPGGVAHIKGGGAWETTVKPWPFRVTVFPTTAGSAPKRRCHSPWDRIVTGGAPGVSSSGRKPRRTSRSVSSCGAELGLVIFCRATVRRSAC